MDVWGAWRGDDSRSKAGLPAEWNGERRLQGQGDGKSVFVGPLGVCNPGCTRGSGRYLTTRSGGAVSARARAKEEGRTERVRGLDEWCTSTLRCTMMKSLLMQ